MTETERITDEVLARRAHREQTEDQIKVLGLIACGLEIDAARAILPGNRELYKRLAEVVRESQFSLYAEIPPHDPLEVNEILAFGYPHGNILTESLPARFMAWLKKPVRKETLQGIAWGLVIIGAAVLLALLVTK